MEGDDWIPLATAAALIGTRDAARRIQRGLMLGTVRARGVIPHGGVRSDIPPEGVLVEIPASEFASLGIDCARSRAIPGERASWRVTIYAAVEVIRADVEALARQGEQVSATELSGDAGAIAGAIAERLREMFPGGPPQGLRRKELAAQLRKAAGATIGEFSETTFDRARALAWPRVKRRRSN